MSADFIRITSILVRDRSTPKHQNVWVGCPCVIERLEAHSGGFVGKRYLGTASIWWSAKLAQPQRTLRGLCCALDRTVALCMEIVNKSVERCQAFDM